MIQSVVAKIFGTRHEREMKKLAPLVAHINSLEPKMKALSDEDLRGLTVKFKERIAKGESLDALLPEAFAACREGSARSLGMRHYDVQLIGGIVLHRGQIAEMRTGEGKTLTATLALYLNALAGKGAHLVTVNDYLARRDAEWMGKLYGFMGLTTGIIVSDLSDRQRRDSYASDITYGTNNEFGFDYLRDNMKYSIEERAQRGLAYAIVDEVDSILIDEARTPLIISGQAELNEAIYHQVNAVIVDLKRDEDYLVDEEHRSVTMSDEGIEKIQDKLGIHNLFAPEHIGYLHHVTKSLEAHTLYRRDEKYMVIEGKVVIVDEFTGRAMPGRRWSDGLHQAIEAKEGVRIQPESTTMATITYQNFFRMYGKLSGMTGTAETEAEELNKIYKLTVNAIPTNRSVVRIDQGDVVYMTEREKFDAIIDQITACNEKGQPVLVGTVSVDKSEVISKILKKRGILHNVLNAKHHDREAEIIAQAGRKGAVTIATNMAGRGTDILLGGNPEAMARAANPDEKSEAFADALKHFKSQCADEKKEVMAAGGLFILGTERHESRRIDNQLRGRAGRQGDPGESRFFISLEDELMRRFGADKITGIMSRLGMQEGEPIEHPMVSRSIENAQKRVEGRNFDIRKHLLEYDDVMDVQRKAIYELRRRILENEGIDELTLDVLDEALSSLLNSYCANEVRVDDWDMTTLSHELKAVFGFEYEVSELPQNRAELEKMLWRRVKATIREKIDEVRYIADVTNERSAGVEGYEPLTPEKVFQDAARNAYLRELDKAWRAHLSNMSALRDSVGLHGYAQKDPKHIYKREGFSMFGSMRASIHAAVARAIMRLSVRREESLQAATTPHRTQSIQLNPQRPPVTGAVPAVSAAGGDGARLSGGALPDALAQAMRSAGTGARTGVNAAVGSTTGATPAVSGAAAMALALSKGATGAQPAVSAPPAESTPPAPQAPMAAPVVRALPKVGRNDPCWCGSGLKYKKCHMRSDYEKAGIPLPGADDGEASA
jgi:preprotein translocase subunit SecA